MKKNYISDELLAAYLEGKTTPEETTQVLRALEHDEQLRELIITAERVDCLLDNAETEYELLPMEQLAAKEKDNLCDIQCEEYILSKLGIAFDSKKISEEAIFNKWLKDKGTPLYNVGRLLEQQGLSVVRRYNAVANDLKIALEKRLNIIVVVNAEKLESVPTIGTVSVSVDAHPNIAYHSLVLIDFNSNNETVTVFDPATSNTMDSYSVASFLAAWSDAQNYMVCASLKESNKNYYPHPIDMADIDLTDDLLELREAIAEHAHDVWAAARIKEGWTYGPIRDDYRQESPDLVPYSDLPDSEKQYDRDMAMSTIKLVHKLGYDLIKGEDTEIHRSLIGKIRQQNSFKCKKCNSPIFKDQVYCERCGRKLIYTDFMD